MHPQKTESSVAIELLAAWAAQREVIVVLMAHRATSRIDLPGAPADRSRVRGYVRSVAPTCAYALVWDGIDDTHIPLALVRAIRRPYFNSPEDGESVPPPPLREILILEHQLTLF